MGLIFLTDASSLQEIEVSFMNGQDELAGTIVKPSFNKPYHAIVLVHGSGPADRSSGYFRVLRERLGNHGYLVLSYDKPGVNESKGDWRKQTFMDRAQEVLSAIHFLKSHPSVSVKEIGLFGGSQAGWVMPIAAVKDGSVAFIISISGSAVTVEEQERYRVEHQLLVDGFSKNHVKSALRFYDKGVSMIRQKATVEQYIALQNESKNEPWFPYLGAATAEEIKFFMGIYEFDPVPFISKIRCPFLGIWGALDTYLPARKSVRITRQALEDAGNSSFKLVLLAGTNHQMCIAKTGSPNERTTDFAPKFWNIMFDWLDETLNY